LARSKPEEEQPGTTAFDLARETARRDKLKEARAGYARS